MEERKHIDRLFQEKFKDFEATPREAVWKNISSQLPGNQKRRLFSPLWYKLAGVAAVLALLVNYANDLLKIPSSQNTQTSSTTIVDEDFGEISLASSSYTNNMIRSSIVLQGIMIDTKNKKEEEIATITNKKEKALRDSPFVKVYRSQSNSNTINKAKIALEDNAGNTKPLTGINKQKKTSANLRDLPTSNSLEDHTTEISEAAPSKRLRITPVAAPIYYNNLGGGSSIDSRFKDNDSKGEVTMAYGINFAYKISDKIKIRSGVSKVDMSYNTNNIAFTAAVNPSTLSGINYSENSPNYKIENRSVRPFSNLNASAEFSPASLAAPTSGYINQKFGFIEVPLEIEYVLIDKKIGLNIIGGGSTLILDENSVSLNASNFSTNLGKANNLNNLSFTTNLGVGVDYNISSQFQFNLEPILKYQINTFDKTTGNVNSYYFGVYSGFSFKF
ncbi:hypothetical protein L1I30_03320 [Gillisia sp. M10.2A]|uniref:Outer membrane protein beta-barrel domain-containing protein n=1 Tax=Gillisia lutea TaxID=2909668 RepID=A0ABS9EEV4_9FLAO|nr:hypothetical protein [Gillisia lutea]MCF4100689.1 hypothetical protein [Gillisia lutea]